MKLRGLRVVLLAAVLAATVVLAPAAEGREADTLALNVSFSYSGDISVTLPNGTPVGALAGSTPTVVPAGWYVVTLTEPGCVQLPYFELGGPNVQIFDDMESGEVAYETYDEDFMPNSTYSWYSSATPSQVYTFQTSSSVVGTPPQMTTTPFASTGKVVANGGVVGSGLASTTLRGALSGEVTAAGALHLTFKGKPATKLAPGRYSLTVADHSAHRAFLLEHGTQTTTVTGTSFEGTRSLSVTLTAGRWSIASGSGGSRLSLTVT